MTTEETQDTPDENKEAVIHTESSSEVSKDSKNLGMLCHLLSFSAFFTGLGAILGPLILWLIKKDQDAFVDEHGKEAVNFNITILICAVISAILIPVFGLGILLLLATSIFWFVMTIIASLKASKGESYKYPICIRLIK